LERVAAADVNKTHRPKKNIIVLDNESCKGGAMS